MPVAYLVKLAKGTGLSLKSLEVLWDKAKDIAKKQDKENDFALITHIFKGLVGMGAKESKLDIAVKLAKDIL